MGNHYLSKLAAGLRTGATRRQILQGAGVLAAGLALPARVLGAQASGRGRQRPGAAAAPASIYASIGVRPLINARGTVTIVGATRMLPETRWRSSCGMASRGSP